VLKFLFITDPTVANTAFLAGEIDYNECIPADGISQLNERGEYQVHDQLAVFCIFFNTQIAPFNDARVRKAFGLSIDRTYIAEKASSAASPAYGYLPPGISEEGKEEEKDKDKLSFRDFGKKYWSIDPNDYQKNCEEARRLLAEAGFPGGTNFPQVEYLVSTTAEKPVVEALRMQWERELGIKVSIETREFKTVLSDVKEGKFSMTQLTLVAGIDDPNAFLYSSQNNRNFSKYSNIYFDDHIDATNSSFDDDIRFQMAHECEDIFMEDMPILPVSYPRVKSAVRESLSGVYINSFGYPFLKFVSLIGKKKLLSLFSWRIS
jgi:oligopeptide transport system substrate-binding protein